MSGGDPAAEEDAGDEAEEDTCDFAEPPVGVEGDDGLEERHADEVGEDGEEDGEPKGGFGEGEDGESAPEEGPAEPEVGGEAVESAAFDGVGPP